MSIRPSLHRFPIDPDAQEASGTPWGVTVTPFSSKDENGNSPVYGSGGDLIPRCENCYGYYNTYCDQDQWAWTCALCGTLNGLSSDTIARYSVPENSAENMSAFVDLEMPRYALFYMRNSVRNEVIEV
ncbi:sec23/sec24, helical domain-containing protein [Tanacetum coccineum]